MHAVSPLPGKEANLPSALGETGVPRRHQPPTRRPQRLIVLVTMAKGEEPVAPSGWIGYIMEVVGGMDSSRSEPPEP